jgi:hypothetical protein
MRGQCRHSGPCPHMVIAALGCNFAWGIIDAGMYLMARLGERGHNFLMAKGIREAPDPKSAHRIIANGLPAVLASVFGPAQLELVREKINQMSPSDLSPKLTGRDFVGASGICILVILSTFPVVLPFVVFEDTRLAVRLSNAIAIILLFVRGFLFARYAGLRPWATGLIMVAVGVVLVSLAIALGG